MRATVATFVLVLLLCACGAKHERQPMRLTVGVPRFTMLSDDGPSRAAVTSFAISAPVHAVDSECSSLSYRSWAGGLRFNGRSDGAFGDEGSRETGGSDGSYDLGAGSPGTTLQAGVTVTCDEGPDRGARARWSRSFQIPRMSCLGGVLQVYALDGRATFSDDDASGRNFPLHAGDLVHEDGLTTVHPSGTITVGATECNGFVARLSGPTVTIGGYEAAGRGQWFFARRAEITGDEHAGGVVPLEPFPVAVATEAAPCASGGCSVHPPSTVSVTAAGKRVVVRVESGAATITGVGHKLHATAGTEVHIRCSRAEHHCAADAPRTFTPN